MEEGAAGPKSEAWLANAIVPVTVCCQLWQWNMISPPPPPPLNQSRVSLWRGGGERCSARAALLRWCWWFGGWDGEEICASRLVNHAHVANLLSILQSTRARTRTHTRTHTHTLKQTPYTQKKHTPTHLTQANLTVTDLFVLIASGTSTAKTP